ncbi:DUF4221 family protein [Anditalea andensis]|nr:DUF4221 family protein [Anditalea andensis]
MAKIIRIKNLIVFITVAIFACSSPQNKENINVGEVFELKEDLKIFDLPDGWGHFNLVFKNLSDEIYFFNYNNFSLAAFDKENQNMIFLTTFESEGPNGVDGRVLDFTIDDEKNIWFFTTTDQLYKMNSNGEILEKHSLETGELMEENISLLPNNFQKVGDVFYFPAFPMVFKWTDLSVDELSKLPNLVSYNLQDQTYEKLNFYDRAYLGNNLNKFIMPFLGRGKSDEIIINHNYKDIYVYHHGEVDKIEASLSEFSPSPPVSERDMFDDMEEIMRIMHHTDSYMAFSYFPKHHIYVRTAKFEEIPEAASDNMNSDVASKWALIILDEQYNKLGEISLPEKGANGDYIFDTPEGLWFSTDHPDNPQMDEDKLQFRLLSKN